MVFLQGLDVREMLNVFSIILPRYDGRLDYKDLNDVSLLNGVGLRRNTEIQMTFHLIFIFVSFYLETPRFQLTSLASCGPRNWHSRMLSDRFRYLQKKRLWNANNVSILDCCGRLERLHNSLGEHSHI